MKQTQPAPQLTSGPPEVIAMRMNSTIAVALLPDFAAGLWWLLAGSASGASRAADERLRSRSSFRSIVRSMPAPPRSCWRRTSGLFSSEGLAVNTNIASGSADGIARVAAGTSDFALVDINELIRFRDKAGRAADQGGVRAVQQGALCHHRPQEPRHPRARPISKARRSASPRVICRSGSGRRWRGKTASRPQPSSRARSAPRCESRCCRRVRSMP